MREKRILSLFLAILLLLGSFSTVAFGQTVPGGVKYEIAVAVDPDETNIDYSNLEADLKSEVVSQFNSKYSSTLSPDDVVINFVQPNNIKTSNEEAWTIYDHYYSPTYAASTKDEDAKNALLTLAGRTGQPFYYYQETSYYNDGHFYTSENEGNTAVYLRDKHIYPNGSRITFMGYGDPGMNDFMIYPDKNTQAKTIDYTIYENSILLHTFEGAGFLINAGISGGAISGYVVYSNYANKKIELYKIDGLDVDYFHSRIATAEKEWPLSYFTGKAEVTLVDSKASILTSINIKNIRIEVANNKISYYEINPNTFAESVVYNDYTITPTGFSGYGPLVSYTGFGHSCTQLSSFVFENINIKSNTTKTFDQKILEPKWHDGAIHALINIDNSGIVNFDNDNSRTEMLMRLIDKDVHYLGWGDSDETQELSFIKDNNDKGIFVNTSTSAVTFSDATTTAAVDYNAQVTEIAKYLVGMVDPDLSTVPVAKIAYNGTNLSSASTASIGRTIVEDIWSIKEADSTVWQTTTDAAVVNTSLAAMIADTGTAKNILVQLVVKDDVGDLSSPDVIYLSTETNVKPVASFTIDESIEIGSTSLNSVTPDNLTFDPFITATPRTLTYIWTVMDEMSQIITTSSAFEPTFNFSGLPAGRLDIGLTVSTNGGSIVSNTFTQSFNIIDTVNPTLEVSMTGNNSSATLTIDITDEGSGPAGYRVITTSGGIMTTGPWVPAIATNTITKTYTFAPNTVDAMLVQAKDGYGNITSVSDFDIPYITFSPSNGTIYVNDKVNGKVVIGFGGIISPESNNRGYYLWSNSNSYLGDDYLITSGTAIGNVSTVNTTPGALGSNYYLHTYAINNSGLTGSAVSGAYTFAEDNTAPSVPTINLTTSGGVYIENTWAKTTVTVTISSSQDGGSQIINKYKINDGSWITGNVITISTDGIYSISYKAVDYAENESSENTVIVKKAENAGPAELSSLKLTEWLSKATLQGTVLNPQSVGPLTEYGFVYSKTTNPTVSDNKLISTNINNSIFTGEVNGLSNDTLYYFKAFAVNQLGTYYSEQNTFHTNRKWIPPTPVPTPDPTPEPDTTTEPGIEEPSTTTEPAVVVPTHWAEEKTKELEEKFNIDEVFPYGINYELGITRGEIAGVMSRIFSILDKPLTINNEFTDINESHRLYKDMMITVQYKIFKGYGDGTVKPDQVISREEMAAVIHRAMNTIMTLTESSTTLSYKDKEQIKFWAQEQVSILTQLGIFEGYDDGEFKPENTIKIGEAVTAIYRMAEYLSFLN